jgi:hypothetical protein
MLPAQLWYGNVEALPGYAGDKQLVGLLLAA